MFGFWSVFTSVFTLVFVSILSMRDGYARMFKRYWRVSHPLFTVQPLRHYKKRRGRAYFKSTDDSMASHA